jgi:hypothetical protein
MNRRLKNHTRAKTFRHGITLLEVLISMFVALVGLSGLAALFWLGGIEMSEGAKLDRAMAVARAAQRSFKILGMHRPIQTYTSTTGTTTLVQTWATPAGATIDGSGTTGGTTVQPVMPFSATSFGTGNTPPSVAYGNYTQGFAIDPIGVNANATATTPSPAFPAIDATGDGSGAAPAAIAYTPLAPTTALQSAPSPTIPCLSRITFQANPQSGTASTATAYPQTMTLFTAGQADLVFRSQDDLLLNTPNGDYPPTQVYSAAGRRQSQGDYSWLATVVPGFSTYLSDATKTPTAYTAIGDTNLVRVSIVVFYKRNAVVLPLDTTYAAPPPERMVWVNIAPAATATATNPAPIGPDGTTATGTVPTGVAGGDIQLASVEQSYLNLKAGQWIMLSQTPPTPASAPEYNPNGATANTKILMNSTYWYRWYKVVATGAVQQNTTGTGLPYYRNVTLAGPDWNPNVGVTATVTTPTPTYASIFDGVVAVYEKEIELEQSGAPWSPN